MVNSNIYSNEKEQTILGKSNQNTYATYCHTIFMPCFIQFFLKLNYKHTQF